MAEIPPIEITIHDRAERALRRANQRMKTIRVPIKHVRQRDARKRYSRTFSIPTVDVFQSAAREQYRREMEELHGECESAIRDANRRRDADAAQSGRWSLKDWMRATSVGYEKHSFAPKFLEGMVLRGKARAYLVLESGICGAMRAEVWGVPPDPLRRDAPTWRADPRGWPKGWQHPEPSTRTITAQA